MSIQISPDRVSSVRAFCIDFSSSLSYTEIDRIPQKTQLLSFFSDSQIAETFCTSEGGIAMKKSVRNTVLILLAVVVVLCVALVRVKWVPLGDGSHALLFSTVLEEDSMGGAAYADLLEQLEEVHGADGAKVEAERFQKDGQPVIAYETATYQFKYLGTTVRGAKYAECQVETTRIVVPEQNEQEILEQSTSVVSYVGWDDGDLDSDKRAEILWDTKAVQYQETIG